jgi:hypothetical protein
MMLALLLQKSMSEDLSTHEQNLYNQLLILFQRQARFDELRVNRQIEAYQSEEEDTRGDSDVEEHGSDPQQAEVQ